MRKTPKWAGTIVALWSAFQVAACDSPTAPDLGPQNPKAPIQQPAPDTAIEVTGVSELVAGGTATIRGKNLDRLASLRVDGVDVTFQRMGSDSARFTVPAGVQCETDGRPVEIVANGELRVQGALRVEDAIRLEVGESRILSAQDLSCVQLAAGTEEYVLSVASFSAERIQDHVLRLRSAQAGGPATNMSAAMRSPSSSLNMVDAHVASVSNQMAASMNAQGGPNALVPFDNYANAKVGDILTFVDWNNPKAHTATKREDVPTYEAVVVAATAGQLIVADRRMPNHAEFTTAEAHDRFQRAAELADVYGLRAIRRTVDPDVTVPNGAGGRVITIITPLSGIGGTILSNDMEDRNWSSNTFTALVNSTYLQAPAGVIAGTIIHETAHLADRATRLKGKSTSAGWFTEALAVFTEDMAARMNAGTESPRAADYLTGTETSLGSRIARRASLNSETFSPWGDPGSSIGSSGLGSYDRGARLIRHVAEKLGLAGFHGTETLYQRLQAKAATYENDGLEAWVKSWGIESLAAEAGMTPQQLMEEAMIADLTDDLLPPSVVASYNLPQTSSWDRGTSYDATAKNRIEKSIAFDHDVTLPAGAFAYWYIQGKGGLSFEGMNIDMQPHHQVRLIRTK